MQGEHPATISSSTRLALHRGASLFVLGGRQQTIWRQAMGEIETIEQLVGIVVGALVGYMAGYAITGGGWRHVGGGWFVSEEARLGCVPGCLLEIVLAAIGAGVGFLIGSLLAG
jgi:hypothetical protein